MLRAVGRIADVSNDLYAGKLMVLTILFSEIGDKQIIYN